MLKDSVPIPVMCNHGLNDNLVFAVIDGAHFIDITTCIIICMVRKLASEFLGEHILRRDHLDKLHFLDGLSIVLHLSFHPLLKGGVNVW